jgi:serine/threonine protein kinase
MINGQDSSLTLYISDFGLSKKQNTTSLLELAGSPLYMAPEIDQGRLHAGKGDIWSSAVMMLLVLGYFCLKEPDLPPNEWKDRMALLPGYRSDLTFEADQRPTSSLSGWKNQLRWYGRLRLLVQHKMLPPLLVPLLAEGVETRLDAQQCLFLFFSEQYKEQPATKPKPSTPRTRTFGQEGSGPVRRIRNNRKPETIATTPRPLSNLRSQKLTCDD